MQQQYTNDNLATNIEKIFKDELDSIKHNSRVITEVSKCNVHGITNNKLSSFTTLTSDSNNN
jgi:hypothetical protein